MNVYVHRPEPDAISLYIDGNLQFDSRDEAVYHESLALPALCLANNPRTVLICGGGDGLVLREVLRYPGVERVTLIDCSPEVVALARGDLAELNAYSMTDPRVQVVIADALTSVFENGSFDVIYCDFTFPTTPESALGFTEEWYIKLRDALAPDGVLALNSVSPQNTPSAFACIVATVRSAGLHALPYRVCIPTFRDHGYGAWGFVLAAHRRLTIRELSEICCPVETRQTDLKSLARGARFSIRERMAFSQTPVNRASKPVLQKLLLNPTPAMAASSSDAPPEFPNLLRQLEITHPYHSRSMVETLAEQVAGSLQSIDLRKLLDALVERSKKLPAKILEELSILREFLSRTVLDLDRWGLWASRLFATLLIVMTVANSISPDQAFAKGAEGLGHSSFSRTGADPASFGGGTRVPNAPISGRGFRSTYGRDPVDIYGYYYPPRIYSYGYGYYDSGYGSYGGGYGTGTGQAPNRQKGMAHKPLFVLDDDLIAMDNGDFVIPLSDAVFLVVSQGKMNLVDAKSGKTLSPVFAEPKLFQSIRQEVAAQSGDLDNEVKLRRDWLSWVGWSSSMFGEVRQDNQEFWNLQDLQRRLGLATRRLGASTESQSLTLEPGSIELFVGCHILPNNDIVLYGPGGKAATLDGKNIQTPDGKTKPIPQPLKAAMTSIIKKLMAESQKDMASDQKEYISLQFDLASSNKDLADYQAIFQQNGSDPTYEVDYGTDTMSVNQAISQTQADIMQVEADMSSVNRDYKVANDNLQRYQTALQAWGS